MDVWDKVMNGFASIDLYLYLECDEKVMESRLIGRSEVSGRLDDTPDIIMKRFRTFEKMTVPFIKETLAKSVDQVITVDATKPKEEVYKSIQEGLSAFGIKPIIKADKPSVLFILGGPGAGKGTQCEILVKDYGYKHLSTGDLLREEIKHKGPESASIEEYIKEGKLVPSTTLVKLMKNKIMNEGWSGHYLIDGTRVT
jgi:adenylate kinase family enzyme